MSNNTQHPLESNSASRAEFEKLQGQKQKRAVAAWRAIVETLTGGLPTWAARWHRPRKALPK
jgi:hypothetical protein